MYKRVFCCLLCRENSAYQMRIDGLNQQIDALLDATRSQSEKLERVTKAVNVFARSQALMQKEYDLLFM